MGCLNLVNGKVASVLDISDRGLQYGDGVFETIAVNQQRPEFLNRHLQRLEYGCEKLGLESPDQSKLVEEISLLCSQQQSAVLKIQISSGYSARGYARPKGITPNRIITCQTFPKHVQALCYHGIRLRLCRHKLSVNPSLAGIKHLNRLDQVIARNEWDCNTIHEGLMLDTDGYVIEGTMSNLFLVSNGRLITALLDRAGIAGVMRAVVLEQAQASDIDIVIKRVTLQELQFADEIFMTNSVIGVWPVRQFETMRYQVGPLTRQVQHWILKATDRY